MSPTSVNNTAHWFFKPSPALVESEIKAFAAKADSLANQLLSQEAHYNGDMVYGGPVIVRTYHYDSHPIFYHPRVCHVPSNTCPNSPSMNSGKKDSNNVLLIAAAAATIGAVVTYSLGSAIASYQDASYVLDETEEFQETLASWQQGIEANQQDLVANAAQVSLLKARICSRIKNSAIADIVLRSGLLTTCGIALASAAKETVVLMGGNNTLIEFATQISSAITEPVVNTAIAIGLLSTVGMLFKAGFNSSDRANVRDAQSIKNVVRALNAS